MATPKTKCLIWVTTLVLVVACGVPTFNPQSIPTTDPNLIGTIIAQTANAAATQTMAALPTLTATATFTSTPRNTDTPEPTATATVILLFFTPSPIILTQPSTGIDGANSYTCEILDSSPANGTAFGSRATFDATWKVKNTGKYAWEGNSVDYVYVSGDKIHKVAGYGLVKTLDRGDVRELTVSMLAPKNPGTYTTNWALQAGSEYFCSMSLTIVVR